MWGMGQALLARELGDIRGLGHFRTPLLQVSGVFELSCICSRAAPPGTDQSRCFESREQKGGLQRYRDVAADSADLGRGVFCLAAMQSWFFRAGVPSVAARAWVSCCVSAQFKTVCLNRCYVGTGPAQLRAHPKQIRVCPHGLGEAVSAMVRLFSCASFFNQRLVLERRLDVVLQRDSTDESWGLHITGSEDGLFIQALQAREVW